MLYKLVLRTILKQIQKFPLGNANQRTKNIIEIRRLVLAVTYLSVIFVSIIGSSLVRVSTLTLTAEGLRLGRTNVLVNTN